MLGNVGLQVKLQSDKLKNIERCQLPAVHSEENDNEIIVKIRKLHNFATPR